MISLEMYKKNPCKCLSIPYWKNKNVSLPSNMKIVHDRDFDKNLLEEYNDTKYFRLIHKLKNIHKSELNSMYEIKTSTDNDIDINIEIINNSYKHLNISVTREDIKCMRFSKVFRDDLWILVVDKNTGKAVGSGIAEFDEEVGEGVLEWIQVLPEYHKRGIGKIIVNELLYRMSKFADFVTVSGEVDNITNPEKLYRACGFEGNDVWHILVRKLQ